VASNFAYNTRDIKFILEEWLPTEEVFAYPKYKGYYAKEDLDMFIDQFYKIAAEVIFPTDEDGEKNPARFEDGKVIIPPTYPKVFKYIQENGWGSSNIADEDGTIPQIVYCFINELMAAASPSFPGYVGLATGAANLIKTFGDQNLKAMFLPKMFDGDWGGTMCLTEPSAGSDVGDILSKAFPTDDPRIYKIKGSKIFISSGDGQHAENIIHLYLARIEGAAKGTKGISLFVVPKYWVNEDGSFEDNDVHATGVEHKMGQHGYVTVALSLGDENKCRGWLLGNPPDENGVSEGMAQMFQLMNEARQMVGCASLATAANAYWNTVNYARERIQGRLITNPKAGRTQIINHEDIKRMLLVNKATLEAIRAMLAKCHFYIDVAHNDPDPDKRKTANERIECLTPVCKAYPSDEAWTLIGESIQVHGGYGYTEDYVPAKAARDCKIYSLYEGTNFIQAQDLVGRKWTMKKGTVFANFLKDIEDFITTNQNQAGFDKEFVNLSRALTAYKEVQTSILAYVAEGKAGMLPTYATRLQTATGQLYGAYCLMDQALIAKKGMEELGPDHYDYNFYYGKILSMKYYVGNVLPNVWSIAEIVRYGEDSVIEAPIDIFTY